MHRNNVSLGKRPVALEEPKKPEASPAEVAKTNPDPGARKDTKAWANLFAGNRRASNGMALDYVAPKLLNGSVAVQLDNQEVKNNEIKWKYSLVLFMIVRC